jgi:four helix bundle protein
MSTYTSFTQLDCWQRSRAAKVWTYSFLKRVPKSERDIHDNLKRAARSATRNIAEGFGRHSHKENTHFCRIARGSLQEMLDDLDDIVIQEFASRAASMEGVALIKAAIKSINGYISYIARYAKTG